MVPCRGVQRAEKKKEQAEKKKAKKAKVAKGGKGAKGGKSTLKRPLTAFLIYSNNKREK